MLTRRGFTGFASCALCGITEFVATAASAQGYPPAEAAGRMTPADGFEVNLVGPQLADGVDRLLSVPK